MPKKKKYYVNLPQLLIHEPLDLMMFGYHMGAKRALPTAETRRIAELFMEDFNLCEDDYPLDQSIQSYYRLHKKYVQLREDFNKT